MNEDLAECIRCRRVIPTVSDELDTWEVIGNDDWCCEECLTPAEVQAIGDDAMEMAETAKTVCVRCGPRDNDVTGEEIGLWIVDLDGSQICPDCQTDEDRLVDQLRTEIALSEYHRGRPPQA